ncbi:alpha/beta fold hydrolase [Streptomyces longispororuber]|uniref:alpha/beta fold hydrolase n=1 Tax=Streptomyces longispororuber TaxID=68230 RepID=UPI00210DC6BA|nr:alpha/beta hydrolase [Streptomyces longispororuber]MCQ4205641.1 alpha/beta hydrolase [Streptomyces longispororuber]
MEFFTSYDGARLAYHVSGEGPPLVCLPGGPQDSAYLGDLGCLPAHRQVVRLDLRGTGASAMPDDLALCRCDRMVDDVEALREHLGLDRMDLLAHSGGANLAVQYVSRCPERISRLVLVTPSVRAVGIAITADLRRETVRLRRSEPWFPEAFAALEAIAAGQADTGTWQAIAPFSYGRWDEAARAHQAAEEKQMNMEVVAAFGADGAFTPHATRAAIACFSAPVLVLTGEVDPGAPPSTSAELAGLFPNADFVVQPGTGHFPWLDGADQFLTTALGFLGASHACGGNLR